MIRIEHLEKKYPNVIPLKDVNTEIRDGDVISVIGPSGTGKSTLLRCINLLEKPTAGRIWLDDLEITDPKCDISKVRQKMGMVFQSFNLFGHLTTIENIMASPMYLLRMSKQEAYDNAMRLLHMVGLTDKALNYPDQLSGGQKQRIAIARTLAMNPDVILLDEPTSALDPTMVGEVQAVIRELAGTGKTLLIVTHEMHFARSIANRIFYMDEGGIYEEGTPEQIFDHPVREKTRRFIHGLKALDLNIEGQEFDYPGMLGELDHYCIKNQIPLRMSNNMRLVFEELLNILRETIEEPSIQFDFEYGGEKKPTTVTVRYNGAPFDVMEDGDRISLAVLKTAVQSKEYLFDDTAPLCNQQIVLLRNH